VGISRQSIGIPNNPTAQMGMSAGRNGCMVKVGGDFVVWPSVGWEFRSPDGSVGTVIDAGKHTTYVTEILQNTGRNLENLTIPTGTVLVWFNRLHDALAFVSLVENRPADVAENNHHSVEV